MKDTLRDDLKAYLDGELAPERAEEVRLAVESDPSLRQELEALGRVSAALKDMAKDPVVHGLEGALDRVSRVERRAPWRRQLTLALTLAGVAVLGAVLFPVVMRAGSAGRSFQAESMAPASAPAVEAPSRVAGAETKSQMPADERAVGSQDASVAQIAPTFQRLLVKTGSLSVRVEDVQKAAARAEALVQAAGGDVQSSQVDTVSTPRTASMTLKVPVSKFRSVLDSLEKLGISRGATTNTEDVTAAVADVEARLKTLRAEEEQLRLLLGSAKTIAQILSVRDRLTQVRTEIESLAAQAKTMRNLAALSTIELSLHEEPRLTDKPEEKAWPGDAWVEAVQGLQAVGRFLGTTAIFLLVYSPIWLPLVLLGWWLWRRVRF